MPRCQVPLIPHQARSSLVANAKVSSPTHTSSSEVLPIENAERFLQRFNLLFPSRNTIVIADSRVNTGRLQLVEICKCGIQFLLRSLEVGPLRRQSLVFVLLLCLLVFDVLGLGSNIYLRICHEGVVSLLG